jgi:hypothetical protein
LTTNADHKISERVETSSSRTARAAVSLLANGGVLSTSRPDKSPSNSSSVACSQAPCIRSEKELRPITQATVRSAAISSDRRDAGLSQKSRSGLDVLESHGDSNNCSVPTSMAPGIKATNSDARDEPESTRKRREYEEWRSNILEAKKMRTEPPLRSGVAV